MKYVGVIKAHHVEAADFNSDRAALNISPDDVNLVKNYIENRGRSFVVTMLVVRSLITNESITGLAFYTDGFWIWPSYFSYYLEKNAVKIPSEFLAYVKLKLDKDEYEDVGLKALTNAINHHKTNFISYIYSL